MNYILCETASKQKYNAAKARMDVKKIAIQAGYEAITLFHNGYFKPYIVCEMICGCFMTIYRANKNDRVLIQYPYYPNWVNRIFLQLLWLGKKIKKYQVTMLIHDIPALRQRVGHLDDDLKILAKEIHTWSWVDRVICHNENMREILKKAHPFDKYVVLDVFDYLYNGPICERTYKATPVVMVAGNLAKEKSGYIYELDDVKGVHFDLFGANYSGGVTENVKYRGKYPSDELISHMDGQFGLVWDGDSIDTCNGDCGEYLKYNNPHKFSLYIAAAVPVIVWEHSALADYVEKNGLGVCVRSLHNLLEMIGRISETDYQKMCQNVKNIRESIVHGDQLKRLI